MGGRVVDAVVVGVEFVAFTVAVDVGVKVVDAVVVGAGFVAFTVV